MGKVIKIKLTQECANYGINEEIDMRNTLPLPAASTVIGAIHKAAGWNEYHKLRVGISGEYDSVVKQTHMANVFLSNCKHDRGTLVKLASGNALSNAYTVIAKALNGKDVDRNNRDFRKRIGFQIFRDDLIDEFIENRKAINQISVKLKKIKEEKRIEVNKLTELSKKQRRQEYNEEIKELTKEKNKLKAIGNLFKTLEKTPRYINVLTNVRLTLYICPETEKDYKEILEHVYDIQSIGRSEDFIDITSIEELEYKKAKNGNIKEHVYIPKIECNHYRKNGKTLSGTIMSIKEKWHINEQKQRMFHIIPCLYASNVQLIEEGECTYKDGNGDMFVLIN